MYNGVGISTPRGSGSNGHVQTNLAAIKTKKRGVDWKTQPSIKPAAPPTEMVEDEEQIRHGRKRKVEILVMEWAAEKGLLDDDIPEEELNAKFEEARKRFERDVMEEEEIKAQRVKREKEREKERNERNERYDKSRGKDRKRDDLDWGIHKRRREEDSRK